MATMVAVNEIRDALSEVVVLAGRELDEFWNALYQSTTPERFRDELLRFFPDLVTAYGDTAGVLGSDWYELTRQAQRQGVSVQQFRSVIAMPTPDEQAISSAKWALGPMFDEQADAIMTLERLHGALDRFVKQPFRDSVWFSAASDPVRTGVLRMPSGSDTCKFCVMLASRGPVYSVRASGRSSAGGVVGRGSTRTGLDSSGRRLSGGIGGGVKARGSQAVGNSYHDRCDCVPVLIQSPADVPDGYSREHFLQLYQQNAGIGRYSHE